MNDDDAARITEQGMAEAVMILVRDGFLKELTFNDDVADFFAIKDATERYVEASVAKGEKRTNAECRDAILIGYFSAWVEDQARRMVN